VAVGETVTDQGPPTERTVLMRRTDTTYRGQDIRGRLLRAEGGDPVTPPGVGELPAAGSMWVSPALKRLLASDEGELLRERLPYRIAGVIGHQGLLGSQELAYYAGSDGLRPPSEAPTMRVRGFNGDDVGRPLDPVLVLLIVVICVVLLLPVAAFIAAAVRFGGERRDRRLAALRLVGADARMTRRVAAGEAMTGSLLGLVVGAAVFVPLRWSASWVELAGLSLFPSDVQPALGLLLLVVLGIPACAVGVSLLALRGVVIEPLGVVRRSVPRKRRLWWRLLPTVAGLALLLPMIGGLGGPDANVPTLQIAGGIVLVLVGITAVLPWLVEAVVRRLRAGAVPLQLAVRRLQLDSGTASRAVSGIMVSVAGAIALQLLFSAVQADRTSATGADPARADLVVSTQDADEAKAQAMTQSVAAAHGVRAALGVTTGYVAVGDAAAQVQVGGCRTLRELAHLTSCHPGDVFLLPTPSAGRQLQPGARLDLSGPAEGPDGKAEKQHAPDWWTVPDDARTVQARTTPGGGRAFGVLATPEALDTQRLTDAGSQLFVTLDDDMPDAVEYMRNAAASVDPGAFIYHVRANEVDHTFATIERTLFAGAVGVLLLIGASMVVSTLEQLRERKRLLSVLVAFGTRRRTLAWSVLWQTALPVALGMVLAAATGLGLGVVLLRMASRPLMVDWAAPATAVGLGAALILLVTLISMPALWRLMRPEGLRTE
jgi:predicted lysophospholipase L1 biosynthesis ABC-type transport system permease subunit